MRCSVALSVVVVLMFAANLIYGSVSIPPEEVLHALMGTTVEKESWRTIIMHSRLPQALTAMLCGSGLSCAGLVLQTLFRNPLAGPGVLGITSGASLGVALVTLLGGGMLGITGITDGMGWYLTGALARTAAAMVGAVVVTLLLLALQTVVRSAVLLLIVGIMLGYLTSSVVALLNMIATATGVQTFVVWGLGDFSSVTMAQMPLFALIILVGIAVSVAMIKPLNALLMGDTYARSMGINTHLTRRWLLLATGLLTAGCTAFCGPVSFLGLAVPHVARMLIRTSDHRRLLPTTVLCGAAMALLCNILCVMPSPVVLPVNAVTPLFGAPVIIYIILRRR